MSYQFKDLILTDKYLDEESSLASVIGIDSNNEPILFDFSNQPHLFIGGDQGCGKSTLIHSILMSLMKRNTPDELQFIYIDYKGVDANLYKNSAYLLSKYNNPKIILEYLVNERKIRLEILSKYKKKNLHDYNEFAKLCDDVAPLPQLFIIIDEISCYDTDELIKNLEYLINFGQTVGFHFIISDTNPTFAGVLTTANFLSNKVLFRYTYADYKALLGKNNNSPLSDDGEIMCFFKTLNPIHGHACFVSEEEIAKEVVKNYVEEKRLKAAANTEIQEEAEIENFDFDLDFDAIPEIENDKQEAFDSIEEEKSVSASEETPTKVKIKDKLIQFKEKYFTLIFLVALALVIGLIYFVLNLEKEQLVSLLQLCFVIFIIPYGLYKIFKYASKRSKYNIYQIDNLSDGHTFEYIIAELLKKAGFYNVQVTVGSGDFGIDVIGYYEGASYAIQCKKYSGKVGVSAVQEAYSGRAYYNCNYAVVVTNNYFTPAAYNLAKSTGVILWDRNTVKKLLNNTGGFVKFHNSKKKMGYKKPLGCFTLIIWLLFFIVIWCSIDTSNSSRETSSTTTANPIASDTVNSSQ